MLLTFEIYFLYSPQNSNMYMYICHGALKSLSNLNVTNGFFSFSFFGQVLSRRIRLPSFELNQKFSFSFVTND